MSDVSIAARVEPFVAREHDLRGRRVHSDDAQGRSPDTVEHYER